MLRDRVPLGWIMLIFVTTTCADPRPTAPAMSARSLPNESRTAGHEVRLGGPVTAKLVDNTGTVVGDFTGTLRVVGFSLDEAHHLVANGFLNGSATVNGLTSTIANRPFSSLVVVNGAATQVEDDDGAASEARIVGQGATGFRTVFHPAALTTRQSTGSCHIASIGLVAIPIDVLGLDLTLSLISLDLNGTTGPDQALGNLLCTLIRLLDMGNGGPAAANVLSRINGLLGGIQA